MKILDRILSCLLILGGIGHTIGSLHFYKSDQMTLLWSLCASLFVFLFAPSALFALAARKIGLWHGSAWWPASAGLPPLYASLC